MVMPLYCLPYRGPSVTPQGAAEVSLAPSQRIQNLNLLVQQIKSYYLVSVRRSSLHHKSTLHSAPHTHVHTAGLTVSLQISWFGSVLRLHALNIPHEHLCNRRRSEVRAELQTDAADVQ